MTHETQRIEFADFAGNLDRIFEEIGDCDRAVLVERNGQTYRLERVATEDIWKDYDPERVKRAIAASAGVLRGVDIEALIADLAKYLASIPVLLFSESTARRCAAIREQLHLDGKRVRQRALDLLIAATALEHDLTLVTRNRQDFEDIPGLKTQF